jgi:hypothetical protein
MSDQDKTNKQDNDVKDSDKYAEYLEGEHVRSIPMMQSPEPWPEEEKTEHEDKDSPA